MGEKTYIGECQDGELLLDRTGFGEVGWVVDEDGYGTAIWFNTEEQLKKAIRKTLRELKGV